MHAEILNSRQKKLLPWLKEFSADFGLAGGTALALQIGHRRSIDFDLFSEKDFDNLALQRRILKTQKIQKVLVNQEGELTVVIGGVKITFLRYPFPIAWTVPLGEIIKMPDILTISALKAYALGRRAKWKDYVDLYAVLKDRYGLSEVIARAKRIFSGSFNEKIFRTQLAYFKDIDYSEKLIYQPGQRISDAQIRKFLTETSLQ